MSHHSLLGAFPIDAAGDSLEPRPDARIGELHASSRNGTFGQIVRDLLDLLPGHESLRFLAGEPGSLPQRSTDAQTRWTVLDADGLRVVIAELDSLLAACHQCAEDVARGMCFGSDRLTGGQIRAAVAAAAEHADPNQAGYGEDGDRADFVFAVFVSLRGLLWRALRDSRRVAVFTWLPG